MIRKNFNLIVIQILLVVLMMFFLLARNYGFNTLFFWPILWVLVLVSFVIVYNLPKNYKLVSLVILSVAISLIHIVALPEVYHASKDEIFEAQFASTIAYNENWDPALGKGFAENYYGHTPVLHFILSLTSITTGLDSIVLLRYFFFMFFRLLVVLFAFLLISTFVNNKDSNLPYLTTLLFIGSAGMAFIGVTRRSTASLFVLLTIFIILKAQQSRNKLIWNFLFMLFSLLIVLSDRSISYYFLLFLIGAWLFSKLITFMSFLKKSGSFPKISLKLVYFILVLFGWLFLSNIFMREDLSYISSITSIISSGFGFESFLASQSSYINIYHFYETFIIYSSQLLFLLLGFIGLFFFVRHLLRQKFLLHKPFLLYLALFGFVFFVFSSILMRTEFDVAVIIFLWFSCIPISFFAIYFLEFIMKRMISKKAYLIFIILILLYLFTGSLLMGIFTPRITNRMPQEDIVIGLDSRSRTSELYYSALWLSKNTGDDKKLLGDTDVYDVFGGFFQFEVNPYSFWLKSLYLGDEKDLLDMIYHDKFEFGSYKHTHKYDRLDYFIVNNAFSHHPSSLFGKPLVQNNLGRLDNVSLLDKIYSNDKIQIYKIERQLN